MKRSPAHEPKPGNPADAVDFAGVARELAGLPVAAPEPRPPRTDTQRYVVERLREPLREAQAQGYSLARLAAILTGAGLTIHASTLRHYLGPVRSGASDG